MHNRSTHETPHIRTETAIEVDTAIQKLQASSQVNSFTYYSITGAAVGTGKTLGNPLGRPLGRPLGKPAASSLT